MTKILTKTVTKPFGLAFGMVDILFINLIGSIKCVSLSWKNDMYILIY